LSIAAKDKGIYRLCGIFILAQFIIGRPSVGLRARRSNLALLEIQQITLACVATFDFS